MCLHGVVLVALEQTGLTPTFFLDPPSHLVLETILNDAAACMAIFTVCSYYNICHQLDRSFISIHIILTCLGFPPYLHTHIAHWNRCL